MAVARVIFVASSAFVLVVTSLKTAWTKLEL